MAEAAYVAYHYAWDLTTALDLEHRDRHFFIEQCAAMTGRMSRPS